tara:strand:- start:2314 stop:2898 length:585 start_codon:yes stop_codon:yes gene_type:complete
MNKQNLVYIDDFGLKGINFYWHKYAAKGLHKEDILNAGLTNDRVQVHEDIINPLIQVNEAFKERGYILFIKEGYRSKELYNVIYKRRVEKFGKEETDKLLNMKDMPHAEGKSVDVALWDPNEDKEVYMRNGDDGVDALFVDFYKGKENEQSKHYQELQEWVIRIMFDNGFRLGTKNEYFHFDYRPNEPENYSFE